MSYDYCGYGQSSGSPNESNLNKACAAVYEKMGERFGIRPDQIILYGQSIGTGKDDQNGVIFHTSNLILKFRDWNSRQAVNYCGPCISGQNGRKPTHLL